MKRNAFTMIELVFVIVVLGILAALAMPRMERDTRQEAIDNVIAAIKYTQHMALNDNVVDPTNTNWQKKFWRFGKEGCGGDNGIFYYVGTDTDMGGNIDVTGEAAIDPANGMVMMGRNDKPCEHDLDEQVYNNGVRASKNIFLTKNHGISDGNMLFSGGCSNAAQHIAFDYLGRPHTAITGSNTDTPNYSTLINVDCNITLKFDDTSIQDVIITVERETGRVYQAQ